MAPTKSRNLNDHERTYVCLKIKEFYDHRNGVFLRGGRQEVKKRCDRANIGISIDTIRRYAREMRDQERAATDLPSGEASGVDLSPNRRGKCGAKTKLTPTLQEGYRKVIERYAYSWRYLAIHKNTCHEKKVTLYLDSREDDACTRSVQSISQG